MEYELEAIGTQKPKEKGRRGKTRPLANRVAGESPRDSPPTIQIACEMW
jgi:hypothetical protein